MGRRIVARRVELRLDQEQLAERASLSRPYISRLERGLVPNPKLIDLESVAAGLDWSIMELVRTADTDHPSGQLGQCAAILEAIAGPEVGRLVAEAVQRYPDMTPGQRTFLVEALRRV
jgi:transcriptional regulator with XRE-family HTH domain